MLKPFSGGGDESWLKKVKLVTTLKGVKDVESFLPLVLEGDALVLYLQLSKEEQANLSS